MTMLVQVPLQVCEGMVECAVRGAGIHRRLIIVDDLPYQTKLIASVIMVHHHATDGLLHVPDGSRQGGTFSASNWATYVNRMLSSQKKWCVNPR